MNLALAERPVAATDGSILRVLACGSVDDGKSTLLGRLMHDAKGLYADQVDAIDGDYAGLFDGLEAEREQGITIDVAYRYFATPARKFIVIDTPGHEQYTRNMVTGASNADVAVILVDAARGVTRQTRRHSRIVRLLGIRHVVIAVNKMDLVGFARASFDAIASDYAALARQLGLARYDAIPLVARDGDNVADRSARLGWYAGPTLLDLLETLTVAPPADEFALPVQLVTRASPRERRLGGTVASGTLRAGDAVRILPADRPARVADLATADGGTGPAGSGDAVSVRLADEVDCARGDVLVGAGSSVMGASRVAADLIWLGDDALVPGRRYLAKLGHRTVGARVLSVRDVFEPDTGLHGPPRTIGANDVATVAVGFDARVAAAPFDRVPALGGFILIDPTDDATVAAGLIRVVAPEGEAVLDDAYRVLAAPEDLLRTADALVGQLRSAGRTPVVIDRALLDELGLVADDASALAALARLLRSVGATPVMALPDPPAIGAAFGAGQRLAGEQDWVI
ncbi:sulfate adenylyltransferase subunit 1 [uncultured Sphingomonas sp.]|uniref:sulfate adenylyltransferase subunit 1 n=1 Tax=uncultured Sphingomonas sp. TaxID=158754 RepID=UPI0035C9D25E